MTLLTLTHANLKVPIYVVRERIDGFYESKVHGARHVLTAGTVLPVSETLDELKRLIGGNDASVKPTENKNDGIQESK